MRDLGGVGIGPDPGTPTRPSARVADVHRCQRAPACRQAAARPATGNGGERSYAWAHRSGVFSTDRRKDADIGYDARWVHPAGRHCAVRALAKRDAAAAATQAQVR